MVFLIEELTAYKLEFNWLVNSMQVILMSIDFYIHSSFQIYTLLYCYLSEKGKIIILIDTLQK